eukprot:gnl/TRDRNA2_/TRDRNA2_167372_c0_seq1.p2 gnl/TRDRNA2_/TRDRNA2_167372_c0~~gnl/TRDRNA2_/TRDRNA2_167372_c0_seq1.p2  ORF type:complete len:124 (+),score=9.32 gnl/TRDRNA2_/TRDRNA2_167372_c0_seq1:148-519(+)
MWRLAALLYRSSITICLAVQNQKDSEPGTRGNLDFQAVVPALDSAVKTCHKSSSKQSIQKRMLCDLDPKGQRTCADAVQSCDQVIANEALHSFTDIGTCGQCDPRMIVKGRWEQRNPDHGGAS